MQYMVTGLDGKEYGPSDLATLQTWVAENRLAPHTTLRDFNTGQTMPASAVPGLFGAATGPNVPPAGVPYPRSGMGYSAPSSQGDHGKDVLVGVIFRSGIAIAIAVFLGGFGFISAAYAMFYAVQCQRSGSRHGILALVIAGATLAIVGLVWAFRLSQHI